MFRRILAITSAVLCIALSRPLAPVAAAEEEETPESAVSSPPMEMDDPGTPGRRGIEINFVGTHIRAGLGRSFESLLDANYGIGDRIQLKYERPYVSEGEVGSSYQHGLGATELGVKLRFVDHGGLEIAAYPQYSFDDGFVLKDDNGGPEPTEGRNAYFPLLLSKSLHRVYTAALNVGFRRNFENYGDDVTMAVGGGRAVGGTQRLLVELFSERDSDLHNRQTDVRAGYCLELFPKTMERSHFEIPAYASIGHSIGATETGEVTTSFTFGISMIRKPVE
jgi:hypothetical protein